MFRRIVLALAVWILTAGGILTVIAVTQMAGIPAGLFTGIVLGLYVGRAVNRLCDAFPPP